MDNDIALLIPIISVIGFFSAIIFWIYYFYSSRHKERMALLESGQTAEIFNRRKSVSNTLKFGIVLFSIGIGILTAYFLEQMGMEEEVAYFSMIFVFSGAGLIGYYLYAVQRMREVETDL